MAGCKGGVRYTRRQEVFPIASPDDIFFAVMEDFGGRRTLKNEVRFGGGGCANQGLSLKKITYEVVGV